MKLGEIAKEIGKTTQLLYIIKSKNKEKYDYMFGFSDNKYESLMMYKEYVIDLYKEVGDLVIDMTTKELQEVISQTDLNKSSVYGFLNQIYMLIDDDNFMRPSLKYIQRLEKIKDIILENNKGK